MLASVLAQGGSSAPFGEQEVGAGGSFCLLPFARSLTPAEQLSTVRRHGAQPDVFKLKRFGAEQPVG